MSRTTLTTACYWLATGLLVFLMTKSAYAYLTQEAVRVECQRLGFPDYFRVELACAKLLGVLALLLPVGPRLREWAYAGFGLVLISALIAHAASGESASTLRGPAALLLVLTASYALYHQRLAKAPTASQQPSGKLADICSPQ